VTTAIHNIALFYIVNSQEIRNGLLPKLHAEYLTDMVGENNKQTH